MVRWHVICLKDPGVSPQQKSGVSWEAVALAFCDAPVEFSDLPELTQHFWQFIHLNLWIMCSGRTSSCLFYILDFSLLPWVKTTTSPFICTGKAPWHQDTGEFVCEPSLSGKSVGKMISPCCVYCCSWRRMISGTTFAEKKVFLADFSRCQRHM